MNKLKTFKYKTSTADNGLFDKITKRYSTYRFLRKSPGRKNSGDTPAAPISGSYDMTGHESDDHKLEIGAPVLISKTTIDADHEIDANTGDGQSRVNDGVRTDRTSERSTNGSSFGELKFSFFTPTNGHSKDDDDNNDDQDYDIPRPCIITTNDTKSMPVRSKSATNLHRTELSVCLQRTPSLKVFDMKEHLNASTNTIDDVRPLSNNTDIVPLNVHTNQSLDNLNDNRTSTPIPQPRSTSKISLDRLDLSDSQRAHSKSRESIGANSFVCDEDFDLKSASCQSLNARTLFLSLEELNDITKQINEAAEYQTDENDLEYCAHRDNLRPVERRITLLRNKNQRLINMGTRRDKLTNVWSGFKSWIGEEKGKLRDVVQRHAALQRVGANFKKESSVSNNGNGGPTAATATASDQTDSCQTFVRNQDFFDRVRGGTGECSTSGSQIDGGSASQSKTTIVRDSVSEFSSLDGDCKRADSVKKRRRISEDKAEATDGGQVAKGRPSKDGWEVILVLDIV